MCPFYFLKHHLTTFTFIRIPDCVLQGRMVRYSNGIEMNGHGRKSKSPDIAMAPIRNGNGVHQVIILIVMEMIIFEVKR